MLALLNSPHAVACKIAITVIAMQHVITSGGCTSTIAKKSATPVWFCTAAGVSLCSCSVSAYLHVNSALAGCCIPVQVLRTYASACVLQIQLAAFPRYGQVCLLNSLIG